MIHSDRIQPLNDRAPCRGRFVLYWMQAAQRAESNHALEYAVERADELHVPLVVFFGLTDHFPRANERHYRFMLEGLRETAVALRERGIAFVLRQVEPDVGALEMARSSALLVSDRGYLRIQRQWRRCVADQARCGVIQVESDVVVPVETASDKEEYSAATLRPKIHRRLKEFLVPLRERIPKHSALDLRFESLDPNDIEGTLASLRVDCAVPPGAFVGGPTQAARRWKAFLRRDLARFAVDRNYPNADATSGMSPYLHFGQISPLTLALAVAGKSGPGPEAFLEELIVRRELSMNFAHYNPRYDTWAALPAWCRATLSAHQGDPREYIYTRRQFERARTHDPYWNAAQREMTLTGRMHGYMRMYWGKKILEWSSTPQAALRTMIALNDKYELDGRDPNGYAGIAWCLGKHDRPWAERPIFGLVRYMNAAGLRRKFDADGYVERIRRMGKGGAP